MSSDPKKSKKKSVGQKAEGAVKGVERKGKRVEREVAKEAAKVEKEAGRVERAIKKEVKKTPKKPTMTRPSGRVPEAMVMSRHGTGMISRQGRGFSLAELSGAGIPSRTAAIWGAMIDPRRRSALEGNVSALKAWGAHAGPAVTVGRDAKEVEERVEEVAHEIKVDAEVMEKEAARAERAAKKEVRKAERAVKEKVAKKPRPSKKKDSS